MFNRYAARCVVCGKVVPPGRGIVFWEKKPATGAKPIWRVECNGHINWNNVKKCYRPKEEQS